MSGKRGRPAGSGSKINRVNLRVSNEFLDMIIFLQEQNSYLRKKSITYVIKYVLEDYVKHPLNHSSMRELLDMSNKGRTFEAWKEKRIS